MNNIKKTIFKIQTESTPTPPDVNTDTYQYGTYACKPPFVGINPDPGTYGGNVYYIGDLSIPFDVTGVFSDPALTIPIPHSYIRTNSAPRYYITVNTTTGGVLSIQPEGDPC